MPSHTNAPSLLTFLPVPSSIAVIVRDTSINGFCLSQLALRLHSYLASTSLIIMPSLPASNADLLKSWNSIPPMNVSKSTSTCGTSAIHPLSLKMFSNPLRNCERRRCHITLLPALNSTSGTMSNKCNTASLALALLLRWICVINA